MSYSLAGQLVFSADIAARLSALSADIAPLATASFVLGGQTPPHITLFKKEVSVLSFAPLPDGACIEVDFSGACRLGAAQSMVWAAIGVRNTPLLQELRRTATAQFIGDEREASDFLPQVTLAQMQEENFAQSALKINASPIAYARAVACRFEWLVFDRQAGYQRYDCNGTKI